MSSRPASYALLRLALLLVLIISFANLAVKVHAGSPDLTVDSVWLEDASQIGQPCACRLMRSANAATCASPALSAGT